jgi:hypothetical protein
MNLTEVLFVQELLQMHGKRLQREEAGGTRGY